MQLKLLAMLLVIPAILARPAHAECPGQPPDVLPDKLYPVVKFETSMGAIEVELNRQRAPMTVNNFLRYVVAKRYDGTVFHRVIAGFVVQGGGYTPEWHEIPLFDPIINESGNGLMNDPYTIAMARFSDPNSATSQFYFNMAENQSLNPNAKNWGYAVFGSVVSGREVLDAIASVETGYNDALDAQDVPVKSVTLLHVTVE